MNTAPRDRHRAGRAGLTRRGWSLLGAAGGLVLSGALLGTPEVVVLGTSTAALLGSARWWAARQPLDVTLVREIDPRTLHAGHDLEVRLRLAGPLPAGRVTLTEAVRFEAPGVGRQARQVRFTLPPPRRTAPLTYRVPTRRRGRLGLGPARLSVTDPFGLVRAARRVRGRDDVLVWPVPLGVATPRWRGHGDARIHPAVPLPRTPGPGGEELLGLRPYDPGDDLRRIHWRTSARTDTLMVRQDDRSRPPAVTIVLDTRPPAPGGAGIEQFERAVGVVAGLALACTRAEQPCVIVTTAGDRLGGPTAARGGARGLAAMLDALATVAPAAAAPARLGAALRQAPGTVVAVGTAGLDADRLGLRRRRRALVTVPVPGGAAGPGAPR